MIRDSATEGIALVGFGSSRPYNKEAMMYCIDILKKEGVKNTYFSFIGREEPTIEDMMKKVFVDPDNGNYSLIEDSPLFEDCPGFEPIPLGKIGRY